MARRGKNRQNKKKAQAHPISAGRREPNGQRQRPTTRSGQAAHYRIDPTPQTVAKVQAAPTCAIQRAVRAKVITASQGQAVERYRSHRAAKIDPRDVMDKPGPLGRLMVREASDQPSEDLPSSWRIPLDDAGRERMAARSDEAYAAMKAAHPRGPGQVALLCGGHTWTDAEALAAAARALDRLYMRGEKAA